MPVISPSGNILQMRMLWPWMDQPKQRTQKQESEAQTLLVWVFYLTSHRGAESSRSPQLPSAARSPTALLQHYDADRAPAPCRALRSGPGCSHLLSCALQPLPCPPCTPALPPMSSSPAQLPSPLGRSGQTRTWKAGPLLRVLIPTASHQVHHLLGLAWPLVRHRLQGGPHACHHSDHNSHHVEACEGRSRLCAGREAGPERAGQGGGGL